MEQETVTLANGTSKSNEQTNGAPAIEDSNLNSEYQDKLEAIYRSQAVIEFEMDGTIITANDTFLGVVGYALEEIQGRHHSLLIDDASSRSADYKEFWATLRRGQYVDEEECKRLGKGGREVWLKASYNPLLGKNGEPYKVVKYAADVTDQVNQREDLKETMERLASNAEQLANASEEMSAVSRQMGSNAEETSAQADTVASSAEQVDQNMQTVATGAEELAASLKEVASNASEADRIANEAVEAARKTNITVGQLGESSAEIGNVIKVITSIAQQTNLLALNATIEAARAGEAGKGFAVVANEVKELAKQTAEATEDISQKIEAIQTDTEEAVEAIDQIGNVISQINDVQGTIASAVEEQSATTNEIARNVNEAAEGSAQIAENIAGVAEAAEDTTNGANDSQRASEELARMATDMQELVARYQ